MLVLTYPPIEFLAKRTGHSSDLISEISVTPGKIAEGEKFGRGREDERTRAGKRRRDKMRYNESDILHSPLVEKRDEPVHRG